MKYLKIETLIHVIMIVFAVASVFNIGFYLQESHNEITSWSIALSLGFGLVAISLILSKINSESNPELFKKLLIATLAVWLLSGTIQMLSYHSHDLNWFLSALFGFGFPLVAEVILALAIASYDLYNNELKIKSAKQSLYEKSAIVLADTVAQYDSRLIQDHINTQITSLVKNEVDTVLRDIFKQQQQPVINNQIEVNPTINVINQQEKKEINLDEFHEYLKTNHLGDLTADLKPATISRKLKIPQKQVQEYLIELQQQDKLKAFVF